MKKFEQVQGGRVGRGVPKWTSLNRSMCSHTKTPCRRTDRMTVKHDWKHYLPATSLAGCNNKRNKLQKLQDGELASLHFDKTTVIRLQAQEALTLINLVKRHLLGEYKGKASIIVWISPAKILSIASFTNLRPLPWQPFSIGNPENVVICKPIGTRMIFFARSRARVCMCVCVCVCVGEGGSLVHLRLNSAC